MRTGRTRVSSSGRSREHLVLLGQSSHEGSCGQGSHELTRAEPPRKLMRACFRGKHAHSQCAQADTGSNTCQRPERPVGWPPPSAAHPAPERGAKNRRTTQPSTSTPAKLAKLVWRTTGPQALGTYNRGAENQRGVRPRAGAIQPGSPDPCARTARDRLSAARGRGRGPSSRAAPTPARARVCGVTRRS